MPSTTLRSGDISSLAKAKMKLDDIGPIDIYEFLSVEFLLFTA